MNPSVDTNVAPREEDVASLLNRHPYPYEYPYYYSGRPIIMIGDIAKDLSNLCLHPPTSTAGETTGTATFEQQQQDDDESLERGRRSRSGRLSGSGPARLPIPFPRESDFADRKAAASAVEPQQQRQKQQRYPGSDDFSVNSMSDVSVDEIFNEVPHMFLEGGVGIMASASSSRRFTEANANGNGNIRTSFDSSAQASSPSTYQRIRKASFVDIDRVDDWIVEPIDLAVAAASSGKAKREPVSSSLSSPLPVPQLTETTLEESESQTGPAFNDCAVPSTFPPQPLAGGGSGGLRARPILSRFPSQEILHQSEKRPPEPPPPGDFMSAYESLAAAATGATASAAAAINNSSSNNNDYSSSTHMQRSAISHPSTLSTNSDWIVFGPGGNGAADAAAAAAAAVANSDSYSPSNTTRARRRSSSHSAIDNEYYSRQPSSSFEQPASDDHVGAPWRHELPERSESFRRSSHHNQQHPNLHHPSTPDRDYQRRSYDQEELMLLFQQQQQQQQQSNRSNSSRLLDRGFGVPVQEHFLSTTMAPSPPSPPPPPPPPPSFDLHQRRHEEHQETLRVPPSSHAPPSSSSEGPALSPNDVVEIEVSPGEFLTLRGSHETLRAIEAGLGQQVTCMACGALLTCINDCLMVICPDCRCVSQTPNENDPSTVWVRMEDGEPSSLLHGDWSGSSGSNHNNNAASSACPPVHSGGDRGGGATDWWERGGEEDESEGSFLGGFAARHRRQEATRRRANVMAISTRPKHGVGLGLKVAER